MSDDNLKRRVLDIADLVAYQDGTIVSRVIVKGERGTVTVFAFDEGQELSEHTAPFDALVQIADGEADIRISGEAFHLERGQSIIMPANVPHAVKASQPFKMILTMIKA